MYISAAEILPDTAWSALPRAQSQLAVEADKARAFGKHLVAATFESLSRTLGQAPRVASLIEQWPGDLASAGVIFRLNAGVHALARSGRFAPLHDMFRAATPATIPDPIALDAAVTVALRDGEQELLRWLAGPTQTNEVARVAGLAAALVELSAAKPMPCDLLELGSSAGLNLNIARYDLHIGGHRVGDGASDVLISPRWIGRAPLPGTLAIATAAGVDPSPLDVTCRQDSDRLHAYIWPGEHERSDRLQAAIALAHLHPPMVERGFAGEWLARRLAIPQRQGQRRVVFHSMVAQYMPSAERAEIDRLLGQAGATASEERPLARVALEWNADRTAVEVCVTQWDGQPHSGRPIIAARCHPYAEWFEWFGVAQPEPMSR